VKKGDASNAFVDKNGSEIGTTGASTNGNETEATDIALEAALGDL
jgi:hypothetical protein